VKKNTSVPSVVDTNGAIKDARITAARSKKCPTQAFKRASAEKIHTPTKARPIAATAAPNDGSHAIPSCKIPTKLAASRTGQ
jgi:hypothetical protein